MMHAKQLRSNKGTEIVNMADRLKPEELFKCKCTLTTDVNTRLNVELPRDVNMSKRSVQIMCKNKDKAYLQLRI